MSDVAKAAGLVSDALSCMIRFDQLAGRLEGTDPRWIDLGERALDIKQSLRILSRELVRLHPMEGGAA